MKRSCFKDRFCSKEGSSVNKIVILDLIQDLRRLPLLFINNMRGRFQIKFGMTPNLMGFTLIELLVVVLIIGILAAVALPQYQVAVRKAQLARLVPLVKTLVTAEEAYYLAHGEYTVNLEALDVEIPSQDCTVIQDEGKGRIECGTGSKKIIYMITNNSAEAGDLNIRYVYFFADNEKLNVIKGDRICFSDSEIDRRACKTLGEGTEREYNLSSAWQYIYTLN